ncbi:Solute carrier family 35 member E1 -like protein [Toxocara canis]|uniref:Solute carrier family 35 member E1-like protein n=1 Tax=Toxocara canis TaxID=6265 RepID=A0A0B2VP71_TOXCA|nr:Solute carrier family 35 member E1 -like protein [Toxocara canis]
MPVVPPRCRFGCQVVLLCAFWYIVSSASSIVNKWTLQKYPYPMSVALASLLSIPLYSTPLLRFWQIKKCHISSYYMTRYVIPISIGKAFAVASAYFSLWKVPVSYAHTVKATMPLFAVVFARLVLNDRQTILVYLSLVPIMAGVLIASLTELSFNMAGLISALMSTSTYALLNVLKDTNVHPITLLALNAQIAALIFFPFWCLRDGFLIWNGVTSEITSNLPDGRFVFYLLVSGLMSFCQNLCAFTLIHRLTALSYAVTNATKRITVISASLLTFRNPITGSNAFGMVLAIMGVFLYNRAKQQQQLGMTGLPLTHTEGSLSEASLLSLNDSSIDLVSLSPRFRMNTDDVINHANRRVDGLHTPLYIRADSSEKISKAGFSSLTREGSPRRMHVRFAM